MKCQCGQPMRQQVIALDDIWWTCLICGRSKPVEDPVVVEWEYPAPEPKKQPEPLWAIDLAVGGRKTIPTQRRKTMSEKANKTLADLNTALFDQLERLSKAEGETLKGEIERTRAVSGLAREIVENAKLALEAHRTIGGKQNTPKMLEA